MTLWLGNIDSELIVPETDDLALLTDVAETCCAVFPLMTVLAGET
jgi:hypothetical protein